MLSTNMAAAAGIADQFQFQIAKAQVDSGQLAAAADSFARVVANYTNSSLRLKATLEEAEARFRLKQWARVANLLENPAGLFQQSASNNPSADSTIHGQLLLAEALLQQGDFARAERIAAAVPDAALPSEGKWRREYLRTRAQFLGQKLEDSLSSSSNLVVVAAATRQLPLEAAAVALQAEILEALNRPEAAIATYQKNQRPEMPPERVRESLFKIVELTIGQGRLTNALHTLQAFIDEHPAEAGSDVAMLTLAELRLKQHHLMFATSNGAASTPASTNLLAQALADCDRLLRDFTNSAFASKAQLVRGWALLALGRASDSLGAFRAAAEALPWSESQAVARFKVADLEFQTGNLTNAIRNYRRVINDYGSLDRVQSELVPRTRFQLLQASRAAHDLDAATQAMKGIASDYPATGFSEQTLLLFGQTIDELGNPRRAREEFSRFIATFPNSRLRPEVELAIARTYERERQWPEAIQRYEAWVATYPTNEHLARAEWSRAVANFQAGRDTNALTLFTNFVVRFPTNRLAAHAQDWVGNFYYSARPEQFALAEAKYQLVYQNWKGPELAELRYRAKLKAGRAALMRPNHEDAIAYFREMINDPACPDSLKAQASFAYGDAVTDQPSTNGLEKFRTALTIFEQIPRFHQNDPIVPRTWGRMAACFFQLGSESPENYSKALALYQKVTNAPGVDVSVRCQAAVGIGDVQRKQAELAQRAGSQAEASALLDAALSTYLDVIYGPYIGEQPDPIWVKEAALNAAAIDELRNNWSRALNLYLTLTERIPSLQRSETMQRKIAAARTRAALQKQ
jgi:tetratricopeptide (TPR) repeat protein